jgi:hypothetical protein
MGAAKSEGSFTFIPGYRFAQSGYGYCDRIIEPRQTKPANGRDIQPN